MGSVSEEKKRVKLTLDPLVYSAFVMLCRSRRLGHPSRIIEAFMKASIKNPTLLQLILKITEEH